MDIYVTITPMKLFTSMAMILIAVSSSACAQPSLISQMLDAQQAVVAITAENTDVFKTPAAAAIDPATGQIILRRKLAAGSYTRNGAGVLIHPDGILVTNAHTGHMANTIKVTLNTGETFYAQPIRILHDMDLLFLKINAGRPLPFIHIANSDQIALGQDVVTIGNSAFLKDTISGGQVIGIGVSRTLKHAGAHRTDLIQTTVNLYHGDSGGPLFDQNGQLIGLMTADEGSTDHSSFAIPSNIIQKYLLEYIRSNHNP